jgi:hypothetical protein
VKLAGGGSSLWPVSDTVDHHAASATNTFAAIMVKGDRALPFLNQLPVHDIQHFQK